MLIGFHSKPKFYVVNGFFTFKLSFSCIFMQFIWYFLYDNDTNESVLCDHDGKEEIPNSDETLVLIPISYHSTLIGSKSLNPTPHISRRSSVRSALGLDSKGCWFEPTVRHHFSSNNVRLFSYLLKTRPPSRKVIKLVVCIFVAVYNST